MTEINSLDAFFEELNFEDLDLHVGNRPAFVRSAEAETKTVHACEEKVIEILQNTDLFCFSDAAKAMYSDKQKVSKFSEALHRHLSSCVVMKSVVKGVNRERSQAAFFRLMSGGVEELTNITKNHQLTVWLCNSVFSDFFTSTSSLHTAESTDSTLSPEESDVAHYIGGFVCCKLKQRSQSEEYKGVVKTLETEEAPHPQTLLAAKSRGKLVNLSKDGQCLFVELEQIFRAMFPDTVLNASEKEFQSSCVCNAVIQDCYHSATHSLDTDVKETVLINIISLYFKVRVNQKCKCIVQSVRSKNVDSSKEKALRSKLAK